MTMLNGSNGADEAVDTIRNETELNKDELKKLTEIYDGDRDEGEYARALMQQVSRDLELREQATDVFNGIPYSEAYEYNRRKAINYSPPRDVNDDREVSMGLVHEKIVVFCAMFIKYAWKRRVKCYDSKGRLIRGLGDALDLFVEHSYRLEKLAKNYILMFWEVFTQGNAFILEDWQVHLVPKKKAFMRDENGNRVEVDQDNMDYTYEFLEKLEYEDDGEYQERKAKSVLLDGRQVIFGNPEIDTVQEQPRLTIEMELPRTVAEQLFGSLDRWKHVPEGQEDITLTVGEKCTLFNTKRLKKPKETVIAHLTYDRYRNRHNLFLNGVMMLPRATTMSIFYPRLNYPLSNVAGERLSGSIYARSIPAKTKFNADFLDWAMKMLAEAFEQGISPALLSKGKYVLSREMFRSGQVTHGVKRDDYEFANEHRAQQGLKPSEFSFANMLKEIIESQTASGSSSGEVDSQATATAIATADAKTSDKLGYLLDGLTMGIMEMVERRIETIESKYTTKRKSTLVDGKEVDVYQNFTVMAYGHENNLMMDSRVGKVSQEETKAMQDKLFKGSFDDKKKRGIKSKYYLTNPDTIRAREYTYDVELLPEQRKNTQLQMISFWDEVAKLLETFPNVNRDKLQEEYLEVSGRPDDLFGSEDMKQLEEAQATQQQQSGFNKPTMKPNQQAQQARRA